MHRKKGTNIPGNTHTNSHSHSNTNNNTILTSNKITNIDGSVTTQNINNNNNINIYNNNYNNNNRYKTKRINDDDIKNNENKNRNNNIHAGLMGSLQTQERLKQLKMMKVGPLPNKSKSQSRINNQNPRNGSLYSKNKQNNHRRMYSKQPKKRHSMVPVVSDLKKYDIKRRNDIINNNIKNTRNNGNNKPSLPGIGQLNLNINIPKQKKRITYNINGEKFILFDYYRPVKILGTGAYAVVVEAIDKRTGQKVITIY